ncbi:hypothetical protein LTR99_006864 [Exophiala xenobiotica]|uniref:Uncharacterized protein n=1 Tax=Vermiconidia calcicola TaxID=1690605 RepID=A0AAV9Q170_9PEZI|nr:hypothetical protein LTR72_006871 [Exophiala xenobiotica]KAK5531860.1 hypothetical protein LTR25_008190 [Vermiconidia calcicola]KAK5537311.1 hypothetical protein LTR23_007522 [Chaetothyriales sp. CCFEE 6169]KAK5269430.1 hypothetical protein LTR96_005126 [Exophiala xenobiotica]KAK5287123.1 hypothetical protein LTR14_009540 [Exophiala xenobiotica]
MFALYLDIQKQIDIDTRDETEVKGRWKSFVGKWNRGDLAEGWYDAKTLEKAQASASASASSRKANTTTRHDQRGVSFPGPKNEGEQQEEEDDDDDDDDEGEAEYGPALPGSSGLRPGHENSRGSARGHGAAIPSWHDLQSRDEQAREDASTQRAQHAQALRQDRILDRKAQKDRLDELLPRAEPGTRERQLEKRREKAETNRAFAASKEGGGDDMDLPPNEVMGGEEDSIGDLKRMQKENERRKNERELRKEEILRARAAEREARVAVMKEKEERTMSMFKEIAQQRFGGRGGGGGGGGHGPDPGYS